MWRKQCCCNEGGGPCEPVDCCDPEEDFPNITAGNPLWNKVGQTTDTDCCCTTALFDWSTPDPVSECCESLGYYQYRQEGTREDMGWKMPAGILARLTGCGSTNCGATDCCLPQPELIARWIFYWQDRFNYFLRAKLFYDTLEVTYGRQLVQCAGDVEPVCRYYIRTQLRGRIEAEITGNRVTSAGQNIDYLHPCYEYVGPDCAGGCSFDTDTLTNVPVGNCPLPIPPNGNHADTNCQWDAECTTCEYPCEDFLTPSACSNLSPGETNNCFRINSGFCIKRIKFFDVKPTDGNYTFSATDTPLTGCGDMDCGISCPGSYEDDTSTVSVCSGAAPLPPWWYTNPPVITTQTTNFVYSGSICANTLFGTGGYTATGRVDCCGDDAILASPCPYVPCPTPTTITHTCKGINDDPRANWVTEDPDECRLPTFYLTGGPGSGPNDLRGGCGTLAGCGGGGAGVGNQFNVLCCSPPTLALPNGIGAVCYYTPCVRVKCNPTNPCGDPACCYTYECPVGCFCSCIPLYPWFGNFANIVEYTHVNSGAWVPNCCEFPIPPIAITLS